MAGKGKIGGRVKDPSQKRSGNPGGERKDGYLLQHYVIGKGRHVARYVATGDGFSGEFTCSKCGGQV